MNSRLEAYLDGRLSEEERRQFERELAHESPALLRAIRSMRAHPDVDPEAEPGPWFTDRVMAQLEARDAAPWRKIRSFFLTPKSFAVRPVTALAFSLCVAVLAVTFRPAMQPTGAETVQIAPSTVPVEFRLHAPGARTVHVVGDFNAWSRTSTPLVPSAKGEWVVRVSLEPGMYQYSFLIDGQEFKIDPAATETVDDGFGQVNALIKL